MSQQTSLSSFFAASTGEEVRWGAAADATTSARTTAGKASRKRPLAIRKAESKAPGFRPPNEFPKSERLAGAGGTEDDDAASVASTVLQSDAGAAASAPEPAGDDIGALPFVVDDIGEFLDEEGGEGSEPGGGRGAKRLRLLVPGAEREGRRSRSLLSDGAASVLDLKATSLTTLPFKFLTWASHRSASEDVKSLAFDSFGALLACGSTDGALSIFDFDEALYSQQKARNAGEAAAGEAAADAGVSWAPVLQIQTAKAISQVLWLPRGGGSRTTGDEVAVAYAFNSDVHVFDLSVYRPGAGAARAYRHVGQRSGGTSCLALLHPRRSDGGGNASGSDYIIVGGGANGRISAWWRRKASAPCWTLALRNGEAVAALEACAVGVDADAAAAKRCLVAGGDRGTIAVYSVDDLTKKAFGKGGSAAPQCVGLFSTTALLQATMRASSLVSGRGVASMALLKRECAANGGSDMWEGGALAVTLSSGVTIALDFSAGAVAVAARAESAAPRAQKQRRFGIANRRLEGAARRPGAARPGAPAKREGAAGGAAVRCRCRVLSLDLTCTRGEKRAERRGLTAAMPRGVWRNPERAKGAMQLLMHPKVVTQGAAMAATDMLPSRHAPRLRSVASAVRRGESLGRILDRRREALAEVRIGSAKLLDRHLRSARQVQVKGLAGAPTAFALHPNLPVAVLAIQGLPALTSLGPAGT